jgi:hypothetical protein
MGFRTLPEEYLSDHDKHFTKGDDVFSIPSMWFDGIPETI